MVGFPSTTPLYARSAGHGVVATPDAVFASRIKARPALDRAPTWFRVRQDRVSKAGNVTVRYLSRLRHIGLGRAHVGKEVRLLIADAHVRVVGIDGTLLRDLVLDADRALPAPPTLVVDVVRHLSTMS